MKLQECKEKQTAAKEKIQNFNELIEKINKDGLINVM